RGWVAHAAGRCVAQPHVVLPPQPHVVLPPQPHVVLPPQPHVVLPPQPHVVLPPQPHVVLPPQPHVVLPPQPHVVLPPQPHVVLPPQPHVVLPPQPHVVLPPQPHVVLPPQPHVVLPPQPHVVLPPQPHVVLPPQPHVVLPPQPHVVLPPQPHVVLPPQPHVVLPPQPHVVLPPQPHLRACLLCGKRGVLGMVSGVPPYLLPTLPPLPQTYTGSILIAANPFMRLPGIYDRDMRDAYRGQPLGELSPHVFAIADNAYRAMREERRSQSILISGESGAGKTETTKLVMEYLASVGGRAHSEGERSIENQVLESNPLLEAFGNAKTVRNDNSSRFGKFIEIQFDERGRVSGAAIRSYLLERSRVVQIADPERNYHCFYQLCDGASPEEAELLKLPPGPNRAQHFHYLNQSRCFDLQGKSSNAEEYGKTRSAMRVIGISEEEQLSILRLLAAVLHLGNVEFREKGDKLRIAKHTDATLDTVASLLSCDRKKLQDSLCTVKRKVGGETIKSALDVKAATVRRDTLAKTLYSKLFDWIVQKVNRSIGQDPRAMAIIGVLDIYGFEHFKINSFEQFCINLANEKLQQHFNQHVLKLEQEEYEKEQINWSYINFRDNQDVLDLIEGDKGILSILDSACRLAQSTAEGFTLSLYDAFLRHDRFSKSKGSVTDFTMEHYAGQVKYSTLEFISKNMDAVVSEHEVLLQKSADPFVAALFPPAPPDDKAGKATSKFASLARSFKQQLAQLMETLNRTEPHYIRCIKPNAKSRPGMFERAMVTDQLRSGGVLEAIRMCSAGYPTRRTFEDFVDRFALLLPSLLEQDMSDVEYVEALLKHAKLENYQIGQTKVFLRAGQMALLQTMRLDAMNEAARKIQRATRHFLFTRHRRRAALLIQTHWRGHCARASYQQLRRDVAATTIQAAERGRQQRLRFLHLRHAALVVQAAVRMHLCRTAYVNTRRRLAATRIQSTWRGYIHRRPWRALKHMLAGRVARLRLHNLKLEASRQAELAPPRKKTDVAIETIRMMTLRVMRPGLAFHSLSPTFLPLAAPIPCLSRTTHIHRLPPFAPTSISALLARLIKIPLPPSQEKAEKSRANSEHQLAEVRAELERTKKELAGKAREVARLLGQLEQEQQRAEQAEERLEEMLREQDRERAEGRERVLHVASVASHKAAGGGGGGGALSSLPSFGGSGFSSSSSSPSAAAAAVAALAGGALGVVVDKHLASQQSGGRAGAPGGNLGVPEGSRILARMASRRHPSPHTPANHPTWEETAAATAAGGAAGGAASAALTSSPSFSSSSSRSSPVPPLPPSSIASPPGSSGGGMAAAAAAAVAAMERAEGAAAAAAGGEGTHDGAHRGHGGAADAQHLPCIQESASREEGEEKKVVAVSRTSSGGSGTGEFGGSSGGLRQVRFPSMEPEESEAEYTRASTLPVGRSMLRQQSMGKALKPAANADAAGASGGAPDGADARLARIRRLQSSNPRMGGAAGGEGGGGPGVPRPLVSAKSLTREEAVRMLASAQRDAEEAQKVRGVRGAYKLKEERRQLQLLYRESVAAAETALAAAAEERGRVGELQRTVEGKDEEIRELTEKNQELQLALTLKAREVRTLSQRLLASQAASDTEELPIDKQQELLLSEVASSRFPFGPEGQPVAACMVYRALLQWGALEAERTNTFDRIVEAFQRGSNDHLLPAQAYWLTNHVVLYYLVQVVYQPPVEQPAQESFSFSFFGMASRPAAPPKAAVEHVDVMLFKQQLATGTERLFVTIRDAAKAELAKHFALPSQESQDAAAEAEGDQAAGDAAAGKGGKAGGGGGRRLARGRARGGGRSGAAMVRKHVVNYWANVVVTLKQVNYWANVVVTLKQVNYWANVVVTLKQVNYWANVVVTLKQVNYWANVVVTLKQVNYWANVVVTLKQVNYWANVVVTLKQVNYWANVVVTLKQVNYWANVVVTLKQVNYWANVVVTLKQVNYWANVVVTLKQVTATLAANHVPAVVVDALLRQLLFFVNVKIVNGLMVRAQWCPCTYSNGELMEEGVGRLEQWVHDVEVQLRDAMGATKEPLKRELRHIRQAIYFLTLDHKPRRSLEEIEELCPDLTLNQLVHMCIWYEDDAYGTKGVDPSVTERMWALMVDDCPMLLRDDESIPFTVDDIALAIPAMHIDDLDPPPELQQDPAFHFLLPYTAAAPHTGTPPLPSTPSMPALATSSDRSIHLPVRSASAAGDYSSPVTTPRATTPTPAPEASSFSAWDLLRGGAWRRAAQQE
ncbi:unnamed protein product, partial [Closterium sp. Naga37s-1]